MLSTSNKDMGHCTDWRMLPEDLEELILSKLPLVDLARVSATSRTFQAAFRRDMARDQKACCDSGVERLGRERISAVAQLVDRFLKGEHMKAFSGGWWELDRGYCILRDGTCHKATPPFGGPAGQITRIPDTHVRFWVRESGRQRHDLHVQVENGLFVSLWISVQPKEMGSLKCSLFSTAEGLPVVQALLSEGLAQMFHDAGHQVKVKIVRGQNDLTQAGFKAVVAPLMPLLVPCTFGEGELVGVLKSPTSG